MWQEIGEVDVLKEVIDVSIPSLDGKGFLFLTGGERK